MPPKPSPPKRRPPADIVADAVEQSRRGFPNWYEELSPDDRAYVDSVLAVYATKTPKPSLRILQSLLAKQIPLTVKSSAFRSHVVRWLETHGKDPA